MFSNLNNFVIEPSVSGLCFLCSSSYRIFVQKKSLEISSMSMALRNCFRNEALKHEWNMFMHARKNMKTHSITCTEERKWEWAEEAIHTLQSSLQSLPSCATMSPGACRKYGLKKRSWTASLSPSGTRGRVLQHKNHMCVFGSQLFSPNA